MGHIAPRWQPLLLVLSLGAGCGVGTIDAPEPSADGAPLDDASTPADAVQDLPPDSRSRADAAIADAAAPTADAVPSTVDARAGADAQPASDARDPADARTGLDCRDAASWPAAWVAFEDEVLRLINQRRAAGATCGGTARPAVGAVRMDAALREAARCHSLDMAVNGYFGHDSQDGRSPWARIAEAGYTASPTGENIAAGYADAAAAVQGWMTSTGHCNNIMAAGSNETGIGYAYQSGSPFGAYWTETFGRR